jgi:four helix bundle protein
MDEAERWTMDVFSSKGPWTLLKWGLKALQFNFEKLEVWQQGMNFVEDIYELTSSFPKEEIYSLTSQIRRAVVSVPSNISEGAARRTNKDFKNFLYVAKGSLNETITQLRIANKLGYIDDENLETALNKANRINKMLFKLIKSLNK